MTSPTARVPTARRTSFAPATVWLDTAFAAPPTRTPIEGYTVAHPEIRDAAVLGIDDDEVGRCSNVFLRNGIDVNVPDRATGGARRPPTTPAPATSPGVRRA